MRDYQWIVPQTFLDTIIKELGEDYAKGMVACQTGADIETQEIIERLNKRFNS